VRRRLTPRKLRRKLLTSAACANSRSHVGPLGELHVRGHRAEVVDGGPFDRPAVPRRIREVVGAPRGPLEVRNCSLAGAHRLSSATGVP
jgi:hypothetical protein